MYTLQHRKRTLSWCSFYEFWLNYKHIDRLGADIGIYYICKSRQTRGQQIISVYNRYAKRAKCVYSWLCNSLSCLRVLYIITSLYVNTNSGLTETYESNHKKRTDITFRHLLTLSAYWPVHYVYWLTRRLTHDCHSNAAEKTQLERLWSEAAKRRKHLKTNNSKSYEEEGA